MTLVSCTTTVYCCRHSVELVMQKYYRTAAKRSNNGSNIQIVHTSILDKTL